MGGAKKKQCECITGESFGFGSVSCIITGNNLNMGYSAYSCDSSFEDDITINFCMFCGRKLIAPQNAVEQNGHSAQQAQPKMPLDAVDGS
jgi:hypothetical protein